MHITKSNKTHHILSMHCIAISDQLAFFEKKYNPLEAIYLTSMWCNATLQNCLNIKCIFPLSSLQETHKANCNNSWQDITKLLTPTMYKTTSYMTAGSTFRKMGLLLKWVLLTKCLALVLFSTLYMFVGTQEVRKRLKLSCTNCGVF